MKVQFLGKLILLLSLLAGSFPAAAAEIKDAVLQRKLADLKSDNVNWNCSKAMDFLAEHVNEVKVQKALRARLPTKDLQEQEAVLMLLFQAKGFQPDKDFIAIVLHRMHHWQRPTRMVDGPAGDAGADYLIHHADAFGDQIAAEISDTFTIKDYSLWVQYAITRALAKGKVLDRYAAKYSPAFLHNLGEQLKSDDIPNNAELAVMTFLFLGKLGVPTLQDIVKHSDPQAKKIARLLLDYFNGKLTIRALNAKLGNENFIGFDNEDSTGDLDDCDLTKDIIQPHYFRFKPGSPGE